MILCFLLFSPFVYQDVVPGFVLCHASTLCRTCKVFDAQVSCTPLLSTMLIIAMWQLSTTDITILYSFKKNVKILFLESNEISTNIPSNGFVIH